jgi:hypothetical protein
VGLQEGLGVKNGPRQGDYKDNFIDEKMIENFNNGKFMKMFHL